MRWGVRRWFLGKVDNEPGGYAWKVEGDVAG